MTGDYRFLPWTRRGLAAEIRTPDAPGSALPARARLGVGVKVNAVDAGDVQARLYGPGDVVGVDPRVIVRTEPRRLAADAEPNFLAAIEFDPPDFPWMFTPAAAGERERLRPWCVLVVVRVQEGVGISVSRDRPLPALSIDAPAVPADELPDLSESWAWAHAQVITEADSAAAVAAGLDGAPRLNLSRILCPRRLEPDRRYYACLVPAFEAGRLAGLGERVPDGAVLEPAWDPPPATAASVLLPLYWHWEFGTGPGGDFESLARKLVPRPAPASLGSKPMYVGAAGETMPHLPADTPGAVVALPGALRAPSPRGAPDPAEVAEDLREALAERLDEPRRQVAEGAGEQAQPIGPPLYGRWHARHHTPDDAAPPWLRELNLDPRHRVAAGLGAEVVRTNDEELMAAAWDLVGDVLAANTLLDTARLAGESAARLHARTLGPLPAEELLKLTAPMHRRLLLAEATLATAVGRSLLPDAVAGSAFRRLSSGQNPVLKRAARLAGGPQSAAGTVHVRVAEPLASGAFVADPTVTVPDGLEATALLQDLSVPASGEVDMTPVGGVGTVDAAVVHGVEQAGEAVEVGTSPTVVVRPDLPDAGVVVEPMVLALPRPSRPPTIEPPTVEPPTIEPPTVEPPRPPRPPRRIETRPAVVRSVESAISTHLSELAEPEAPAAPPAMDLAAVRATVLERTAPRPLIAARVASRLRFGSDPLGAGTDTPLRPTTELGPVLAFPVIDTPLYAFLAEADPDALLPGVAGILPNTVTLLQTNPSFAEAFLAGANVEMGREMLWRGYPTDRGGTVFQRFWDRTDVPADIAPIHEWEAEAHLGENSLGDPGGQLVLLLRGDLLRRYPTAVVYAAAAGPDGKIGEAHPRQPVMRGRLEPDITFVGFDLRPENVTANLGWFFVIAEQPTEPRFGFDEPGPADPDTPALWRQATWAHAGVDPGGHLRIAGNPLAGLEREGATFVENAAHFAAITLQQPVRVAIHARQALPPRDGEEDDA